MQASASHTLDSWLRKKAVIYQSLCAVDESSEKEHVILATETSLQTPNKPGKESFTGLREHIFLLSLEHQTQFVILHSFISSSPEISHSTNSVSSGWLICISWPAVSL